MDDESGFLSCKRVKRWLKGSRVTSRSFAIKCAEGSCWEVRIWLIRPLETPSIVASWDFEELETVNQADSTSAFTMTVGNRIFQMFSFEV